MSECTQKSRPEAEPRTSSASRENEAGRSCCDLAALPDSQIAELVRERLQLRAGHALEGVQVTCRHGVVRLRGEVASAALHALALHIADGELDLETIDDVRVTPLSRAPHGGAGQARARSADELLDVALLGGESSRDILDAEEADDHTFEI